MELSHFVDTMIPMLLSHPTLPIHHSLWQSVSRTYSLKAVFFVKKKNKKKPFSWSNFMTDLTTSLQGSKQPEKYKMEIIINRKKLV